MTPAYTAADASPPNPHTNPDIRLCMDRASAKMQAVRDHYAGTPYDHDYLRRHIFSLSLTREMLLKHSMPDAIIADIGCSSSYLGEYVRDACPGCRYLGIDINPEAVAAARRKGLDVQEGDNLHLDLPDCFADMTVSEGVRHHTPDPFGCFRELIRITKPGGYISLYVYNKHHLYFFISQAAALIRFLNRLKAGSVFVRKIIFPLFNACYVQPGNRLFFKNKTPVPRSIAWNIFSDQILTPIAHFYTRRQIIDFARANGLALINEKLSINRQGLMFLLQKT